MNLQITLDDLATLVTTKKVFKDAVADESKKYIDQLEIKIMALKDQFVALQAAFADQDVTIKTEFDQVKAKFEALHNANNELQANFNALKVELDALKDDVAGVALQSLIDGVQGSIAKIDAISESDVPPADTTPPAIPTDLSAANITAEGFDLSWTADADAVKFEIFQDGTKVGDSDVASFAVTGLAAETAYDFAVNAADAAGNVSSMSDVLNVTTIAA